VPPPPPAAEALTLVEQAGELGNPALAMYQASLESVRKLVAEHRVAPATKRKRDAVLEDLEAWLAAGPYERTVRNCTAEDITVYVCNAYVVKTDRYGSETARGKRCCAPGTVEQAISHLRQSFAQMGRYDRWSNLAHSMGSGEGCNPAWSQEVHDFARAYRNYAVKDLGYMEVSATPSTGEVLCVVLEALTAAATDRRNPVKAALAARDGAMMSIEWATMVRGHDVGELLCTGLLLADGSDALGKLFPELLLRDGDCWLIKPQSTKTEKANVVEPRPLRVGTLPACLEPALWVHRVLVTADQLGQPVTGYLFRRLTRSQRAFEEVAVSSGAYNHAFKKRYKEAGVLEGHTPHGLRRGSFQAGLQSGKKIEEMMELAFMKTLENAKRYASVVRHRRDC